MTYFYFMTFFFYWFLSFFSYFSCRKYPLFAIYPLLYPSSLWLQQHIFLYNINVVCLFRNWCCLAYLQLTWKTGKPIQSTAATWITLLSLRYVCCSSFCFHTFFKKVIQEDTLFNSWRNFFFASIPHFVLTC